LLFENILKNAIRFGESGRGARASSRDVLIPKGRRLRLAYPLTGVATVVAVPKDSAPVFRYLRCCA
jgi:hypothetical protein